MIIFTPSVSRVARGVHGHQAIVFLQLHISAVDREVHHSKHKTTPFLPYVRGQPARKACTCTHTVPTPQIFIAGAAQVLTRARARKRSCVWTGIIIYTH